MRISSCMVNSMRFRHRIWCDKFVRVCSSKAAQSSIAVKFLPEIPKIKSMSIISCEANVERPYFIHCIQEHANFRADFRS